MPLDHPFRKTTKDGGAFECKMKGVSGPNKNVSKKGCRFEYCFCQDLATKPRPEIGKVLVTGATGYIGGRLVPELLERGYKVRVMVRAESPEHKRLWPGAEIAIADALHPAELQEALKGVHTAYYLIHSLLLGKKEFARIDFHAAANFRKAAEENDLKRIIYLGGLGEINAQLSRHLRSRMEVGLEFKQSSVPSTVLRAAIIIGSGSASYEIIKHIARHSPVILVPKWSRNRCQPIAIRDVVKYLVGVLETPETADKSFDIGGIDVLSYKAMLLMAAKVFGKKKLVMPVPFANIALCSYVTSLYTPVPAAITRCLFDGLRNEVICHDDSIRQYVQFKPLAYEEAVRRAIISEQRDNVNTRWSDAYPPASELALKLHELAKEPTYTSTYSLATHKQADALFKSICKIGGKEGWFHNNWMWRFRGMIDRALLGVGSSRGRKKISELNVNDVIDFWRVEELQPGRKLLLRAEMKMPGHAWLEFNIKNQDEDTRLSVSAYFDSKGIFGRIYWYIFLPFHHFIFTHLLEQIVARSHSGAGIQQFRGHHTKLL